MINLEIKFEEPKENPNYFIQGRVAEIILKIKKLDL